MIKGCIFDLDGTLLDTLRTIVHHGNGLLARHGLSPYTPADYRRFVGSGSRVLLRRMLSGRGIADEAFLDVALSEYVNAYNADPFVDTVPYPGIVPLLSLLNENGCRLAVCSNKPQSSVELLIPRYFSVPFTHVLGGAEKTEWLKPSPYYTLKIMEEWGLSSDECLFLGDSPQDMQTAHAAKIAYPVAAEWGYTDRLVLEKENAILLKSPYDVIELVKKVNRLV